MDDEAALTRGFQVVSIALALLAAGALAFASVSYAWAVDPVGERMGYGLRSRQDCDAEGCRRTPFVALSRGAGDGIEVTVTSASGARARAPSSTLRAFGWVTSIACWAAAVTLLLSAVLVAIGKLFFRPIAVTTLALLALIVGMIAGCVFVAQAREIGTVGWAFWVFGVGTVVGIVAAQRLARFKPSDPFWDHPPPVTDDPDKW
jgi:hypothetical protein